jgi:hypothetical protein
MISHKIYKDEELISVRFKGEIDYEMLLDWHKRLLEDVDYKSSFNAIVDQRGVTMKMMPAELQKILGFIIENKQIRGHWCHIVQTPYETALAKSYESKSSNVHKMDVCYDISNASRCLGFDIRPFLFAD